MSLEHLLQAEAELIGLYLQEELREMTDYNVSYPQIIETTNSQIVLQDENGHRWQVFKGDDGRWKCVSCQRYRCTHAQFATQVNPDVQGYGLTDEDVADLIDEDEDEDEDEEEYR